MSRPKGSKNKKKVNKELTNEMVETLKTNTKKLPNLVIVKEEKLKTIDKKFKYKPLAINKIYNEDKKFYLVSRISGFISKWEPGKSKDAFNEKKFVILNNFPTEEEYYNIIKGSCNAIEDTSILNKGD